MNPRTLALGLVLALASAGCKTVPVKGNYNFADHPGKGLVAFSTRMDAGQSCSYDNVKGAIGFRKGKGQAAPTDSSVDARILLPPEREPEPDAVIFTLQTPRPERKVPVYSESTFSDLGGAEMRTIPADPPTRFSVQEVPAGHYLLNSLEIIVEGHPGPYKSTPYDLASFTLKEGEVVYLGEIRLRLTRKSCVFGGFELSKGYELSVVDEWERDRARFKEEIPNISPDAVQKRLLGFR